MDGNSSSLNILQEIQLSPTKRANAHKFNGTYYACAEC